MTQAGTTIGRSTGGKPINLSQLQTELQAAGVDCSTGLGMRGGYVFTFDAAGESIDFPQSGQSTVDQTIANHIAMRDKTDAEYATEFQNPATTAARKQEIRDMQSGLMPREQVPMT
jgi:hypothetical protein